MMGRCLVSRSVNHFTCHVVYRTSALLLRAAWYNPYCTSRSIIVESAVLEVKIRVRAICHSARGSTPRYQCNSLSLLAPSAVAAHVRLDRPPGAR